MFSKIALRTLTMVGSIYLAGCGAITRVEVDKMRYTNFPEDQIVDGETVSITSIYAAVGQSVVLDFDEDDLLPALDPHLDIPDPGPGGGTNSFPVTMSDAELDAFERAHRKTPVGPTSISCGIWIFKRTCMEYHIYVSIVDALYRDEYGNANPQTMGIVEATNRRRVAIFFPEKRIREEGDVYLRTLAHEIGHAFNLHHEDGITLRGITDLMVSDPGPGKNFIFRFATAASRNHLVLHPRDCVMPGMSALYAAHEGHVHLNKDTASCQEPKEATK